MENRSAVEVETRIRTRIKRRLMPFLILLFLVAYIDRVNVGYANLLQRLRSD